MFGEIRTVNAIGVAITTPYLMDRVVYRLFRRSFNSIGPFSVTDKLACLGYEKRDFETEAFTLARRALLGFFFTGYKGFQRTRT